MWEEATMASFTVRRAAVTGLVTRACLFAAAACARPGSDSGPPAGATTVPGTGSIGDGGPSAGTPSGGTPPTTAAPTYPADAETYARQAVAAWTTGDTARLDQLE